jgi:hypothetical protein
MEKISVKAVEGRVAFTAPRDGVRIPTDRYIEVDKTKWIMRLLDHHQDIVQETTKSAPAKTAPKKPDEQKLETPAK